MIQGGGTCRALIFPLQILNTPLDFTKKNGSGGESIYGGTFEDENFDMDLDVEGYVSLTSRIERGLMFYQTPCYGKQGSPY